MKSMIEFLPLKAKWNLNLIITLVVAVASGCSTANMTNPARSATEQLLLSTAADRAIKATDLNIFANKKVFLDGTYFDSYDSKNVLGTIRDALSQAGALLEPTNSTNCDIIVEARSGALSIDESDSLFGIPQSGIPIPLAGALQIPELALYKASRQYTTAKLALLAYGNVSREHVYSSGPMVGKSYSKVYKLLGFIQWNTSDIPEKKTPK